MYHGLISTTVPDPNAKFSGSAIARRRMSRPEVMKPTKCVPRCLFGPPDPNFDTLKIIDQLMVKRMAEFKERWNFDPDTELPCDPPPQEPGTEAKPHYVWTLVYSDEPVAQSAEVTAAAAVNQTPATVRKLRSPVPMPASKRVCKSAPVLKQRTITDYMKVKKPLPEAEKKVMP